MNNLKEKESVCESQCLTGKCPFEKCVKYKSGTVKVSVKSLEMQILRNAYGVELFSKSEGLGIAFDLGTTTIVGALYDMENASEICLVSGVNNQVFFGRDIISRIKYCADNENGFIPLHKVIIKQLNEMISALCKDAAVNVNEISKICISGNTTMLHLLMGLSPVSMGAYPFEPQSLFGCELNGEQIGLISNAQCYLPPCISSFVGADIVGGLAALNFHNEKNASFMDIGTNGEVAAVTDKVIYTSATAAGPAFEGAHISCGMAAAPGAISHIEISDNKLILKVINDEKPIGLTGSGITDAVCAFVNLGEIEKNGKIVQKSNRYIIVNDGPALKIAEEVYITQKDVREFQTAKAALCAGVIALIQKSLCKSNNIGAEKLFLAGGFGNFLNINNARFIGIVPDNLNIISVGNTSLIGAALLMMNEDIRKIADEIARGSKVVDLSTDGFFIDKYIECMSLNAFCPV